MSTSVALSVTVNGRVRRHDVPANLTLSDFLREWLGLSGTKVACDQGACGACTVLVDDAPVTSCLTFAFAAGGKSVRTIEGVAGVDGNLNPVQQAFHEAGVPQCGFCTPGMVMLAEALMRSDPAPSSDAIDCWMSANICRCSGYQVFRRAFSAAADEA
jgi:aerobic-type carbon monoxide dehydrogenase small subunit (CoxS/CutS family)